jgi:hypothetical protein
VSSPQRPSRKRLLTDEQIEVVRRAWTDGLPRDAVAAAAGITVDTLNARRGDQLADLPSRGRGYGGGRSTSGPDPTPDEIRVMCAALRRGWSLERWGLSNSLDREPC